MMMKNKIVHGFDHTADWIAKVRNVSRLGSCSFTRRPVPQSPLASHDVFPTGPPNTAVYSLTGNASSPIHAEPAQWLQSRRFLQICRSTCRDVSMTGSFSLRLPCCLWWWSRLGLGRPTTWRVFFELRCRRALCTFMERSSVLG